MVDRTHVVLAIHHARAAGVMGEWLSRRTGLAHQLVAESAIKDAGHLGGVTHSDSVVGETRVQQKGRPGVQVRILRLTTRLEKVIGRDLVKRFVSREPVSKVLLVGTRRDPEPATSSDCEPNYTGGCVPMASDVDCAGGSGDGPEYVEGPVTVVGDDIYDLNRDSDNIACDS